ncbi:MAG: C40 family peptidase [Clostridia bacterium]|jgi:cell wall-associated NlpC family hydrolase|nr:C40 family peptidase [Clostridia bacterium]MCR4577288.1 C40 family peptidase [Clostridiales bacterium]
MKQKFLRALAIVLLVTLLIGEFAVAESFKAKVYTASAKVYKTNSTKSAVVDTLPHNTVVTVTAHKNGWARITYGKSGYGFCQISDLISSVKVKRFSNKKTKIYQTPSTAHPITTVSVDYPLYRVGASGNYYLVQDKDGAFTGYIKKADLSSSRKNPFAIPNSKKGKYDKNGSYTTIPGAVKSNQFYLASSMNKAKWRDYLVYIAECKVGAAYKQFPGAYEFNNYSLVKACFNSMGYKIPASTNAVGHTGSNPFISRQNLLKGDIVCFDCDPADGDLVDHIGIYIGQGYFVHGSKTAGRILVSTLNSGYYKSAFCWGRRVIK